MYIYRLNRQLSMGTVPAVTDLPRRLLAEFLGSMFLAALVIGSGIAAAHVAYELLAVLAAGRA